MPALLTRMSTSPTTSRAWAKAPSMDAGSATATGQRGGEDDGGLGLLRALGDEHGEGWLTAVRRPTTAARARGTDRPSSRPVCCACVLRPRVPDHLDPWSGRCPTPPDGVPVVSSAPELGVRGRPHPTHVTPFTRLCGRMSSSSRQTGREGLEQYVINRQGARFSASPVCWLRGAQWASVPGVRRVESRGRPRHFRPVSTPAGEAGG